MNAYIPTREELEKIISKETRKAVSDILPNVIRKAIRKEWLTTDEVMEILQCSRRHVQYLRDSKQLTFFQNARTIRYKMDDIDLFLDRQKVDSVD